MVPTNSKAVIVSAEVLRGICRAQAQDGVNKYNISMLTVEVNKLGEEAAFNWLVKHPSLYIQDVFNGFLEEP